MRKIWVNLSEIDLPDFWQYSEEGIKYYMGKYKRDEYVEPPIVFKVNDLYSIEDGAHRVEAARRIDLTGYKFYL